MTSRTYTVVSELEFADRLEICLSKLEDQPKIVIGPGRSGAIASVYASHILSVPFSPYGHELPENLSPILIVDTATLSGRTIRRAANRYKDNQPITLAVYQEPPMVKFWYETNSGSMVNL